MDKKEYNNMVMVGKKVFLDIVIYMVSLCF